MLGVLEPGHLILILLVALLIFGPRKLPELGKSLGAGLREFRKGASDLRAELEHDPSTPHDEVTVASAAPQPIIQENTQR